MSKLLLSDYKWKIFSTAVLTLNFDLDLWKVKVGHKCWNYVLNFMKIGLLVFENHDELITDETTNELSNTSDHNTSWRMYNNEYNRIVFVVESIVFDLVSESSGFTEWIVLQCCCRPMLSVGCSCIADSTSAKRRPREQRITPNTPTSSCWMCTPGRMLEVI